MLMSDWFEAKVEANYLFRSLSWQEYIFFILKLLLRKKVFISLIFLAKSVTEENWSTKFLSQGKRKGYKKILAGEGSIITVDKDFAVRV